LARDYARYVGVQLRGDSTALNEWRTTAGGGFVATGIGGAVTGHGFHLLLVDDPHKNRAEAESSRIRESVYEFCRGTAMSRIEPGGHVIVCHTRWHTDDVIGRLRRDRDVTWNLIQNPALDEHGKALWPSRWPVKDLLKRKAEVGEYDWASLYQGHPRPRGGSVFQDIRFCDELPRASYRIGIGIDLAYSAKSSSDYSTIVVLLEFGGIYYVAECKRVQVRAPEFGEILKKVLAKYPATPRWYCSGTEKGVADLIGGIDARAAVADKFVRAQPVAAAWNAEKVVVLKDAPWVDPFQAEVLGFTGVGDAHDDIVDALAAAFDSLKNVYEDEFLTVDSRW
jgi:predicted phage terminase large subunit-like protein